MPENTVYVGRPTKWGNPFPSATMFCSSIGHPNSQLGFEPEEIEQLRGKNLACWCPLDNPCHADVLLKIANETGE